MPSCLLYYNSCLPYYRSLFSANNFSNNFRNLQRSATIGYYEYNYESYDDQLECDDIDIRLIAQLNKHTAHKIKQK